MNACSKGWTARCACAKGKRCKCACGGENHGAKKRERQMVMKLADTNVMNQQTEFTIDEGRDITMTRRSDGIKLFNVIHVLVYHSPTGFEWGYGGSGPADLALNILAIFVPPYWAWKYHQRFKERYIASMPKGGGTIKAAEIKRWLEFVHEEEQ